MTTVAAVLREIHRLRRHAKDLQTELERGPRQQAVQQKRVANAEAAKAEAQEAIKKLKVANHEREVTLKTNSDQIAKHQRQLDEATWAKEYAALKAELGAERAKCQKLEDDILAGMLEIDEKTAQLPELDQAIQRAKAELAEFERTFQTRQDERTAMLQQTLGQIKEVETGLPEDVRSLYARQVAGRGEDAMALVEGGTCTACYTSITAQNQNELRVGIFVVCKSCGRFLYLAE